MKLQIYNLIILDESGSMMSTTDQTISGCNETIQSIKSAQERFAETQEHFVSIYVFQSDSNTPSRYLMKNVKASEAKEITKEEYTPNGMTPLNDAIGSTLSDLKAKTKGQTLAIGNVTIITDGMENASKEYNVNQIKKMIDDLKEKGWNFNFIGANIDVVTASSNYGTITTLLTLKRETER